MIRIKTYMSIIAATLFMFAAISCAKNDTPPEIPDITTIKLSASINSEEDGLLVWDRNDAIGVINNNKLYKFIISNYDANTSEVTFSVDKSALPGGYMEGDFNPQWPIKAFYPYDKITYDPATSTINYTIPAEQVMSYTSVAKGTMPMAAYATSSEEKLIFNNIFGILKLKLVGNEGENVKNIEISSSSIINGKATISINAIHENTPEVSIYISKEESSYNTDNKKITLVCGNGGEPLSSTPTDFIAVLPAGAQNLSILIHTSTASYHISQEAYNTNREEEFAIIAGNICEIPELNINEMMYAYIENGLYLGDGIKLPKSSDGTEYLIWAPVNCGYEAEKKDGYMTTYKGYPFGKLYQWGRKDGQGYEDNSYRDETYPSQTDILESNSPHPEKFYSNWKISSNIWPSDSDPCPEGWRVPTIEELTSLMKDMYPGDYVTEVASQWKVSNDDKNSRHYRLPGYIFYGNTVSTESQIFFPATGCRKADTGVSEVRGFNGCYWSSTANGDGNAWFINFNHRGYIESYFSSQALGRAVRCVKK